MNTKSLILASLIAIAAVPAFAAGVQQSDPYTNGQAITKADPYTDGALRKAMSFDDTTDYIRTVRSAGYALDSRG